MIKKPKWVPESAFPTKRGWETPKGEVLTVRRHTQEQLDKYYGKDQPVKQTLTEAPTTTSLDDMSVAQLKDLARQYEITGSYSMTRDQLLEHLRPRV